MGGGSHAPLTQGEAEEQEGLLGVNPPGLVLQHGGQQSHLRLPSLHIVGLGRGGRGGVKVRATSREEQGGGGGRGVGRGGCEEEGVMEEKKVFLRMTCKRRKTDE